MLRNVVLIVGTMVATAAGMWVMLSGGDQTSIAAKGETRIVTGAVADEPESLRLFYDFLELGSKGGVSQNLSEKEFKESPFDRATTVALTRDAKRCLVRRVHASLSDSEMKQSTSFLKKLLEVMPTLNGAPLHEKYPELVSEGDRLLAIWVQNQGVSGHCDLIKGPTAATIADNYREKGLMVDVMSVSCVPEAARHFKCSYGYSVKDGGGQTRHTSFEQAHFTHINDKWLPSGER